MAKKATRKKPTTKAKPKLNVITVSDRPCCDCGGTVTLFSMPDKVWKGIGFTSEYACMTCVAKRLNPKRFSRASKTLPATLGDEIRRQINKFGLEEVNQYNGKPAPFVGVVTVHDSAGSITSWTANEVSNGKLVLGAKFYPNHGLGVGKLLLELHHPAS